MSLEDAEIEWRIEAFVSHFCLVCVDDGFDGIEFGSFVVGCIQQSNDILSVFCQQFWNRVRLKRSKCTRVCMCYSIALLTVYLFHGFGFLLVRFLLRLLFSGRLSANDARLRVNIILP